MINGNNFKIIDDQDIPKACNFLEDAAIVAPSKKYVAPVFENGILKGFGLRR